jgi:four helix bundle protein
MPASFAPRRVGEPRMSFAPVVGLAPSREPRATRTTWRRERAPRFAARVTALSPEGREPTTWSYAMRFLTYDLALSLITSLRPSLAIIQRHDAALAKQLRTALSSIALNIAEANGRTGGDRLHHFRIALGSLRESGAVLDVAIAFGWLASAPLHAERDRLAGMLFSLQRR